MLSPTRLAILITSVAVVTAVVIVSIVVPVVLVNNQSKQTTKRPLTTSISAGSTSSSSNIVLSTSAITLPIGTDEYTFNEANTPFTLKMSQAILDVENYVLFTINNDETNSSTLNTVNTTSTNESITTVNGFPATGSVLLSLVAQDIYGLPIFTSFYLYFGSIRMPVRVLFENGTIASGVTVQMNLTDDARIGQQAVTNHSGMVVFEDVPSVTISVFAHTSDNQIGLAGVTPSAAGITITLIPFVSGSTGRKRRQTNSGNQSLTVSTNESYSLQTKTTSFTSAADATQVYLEYQFITQEVPGGFFGSVFNDYFSVTLRSSTGNYQTISQSMNSLGIGAFDFASGATAWTNLTMPVGPISEEIEIVIGVSNVVDNLYQSQVNVDKYGSDKCNDSACDKDRSSQCTSKPMCSSTCFDPPLRSCQFYTNCMEAETACGLDGYALGYGLKYCTKFVTRVNSFSLEGQTWIYSTMNCLQKALVLPLQNCEKKCETLKNLAFSSHSSCYVNSGVCDLPPRDWLKILTVVGGDLLNDVTFLQAIKTASQCIPNLIIRIDAAISETQDSHTTVGLLIFRKWLQSL